MAGLATRVETGPAAGAAAGCAGAAPVDCADAAGAQTSSSVKSRERGFMGRTPRVAFPSECTCGGVLWHRELWEEGCLGIQSMEGLDGRNTRILCLRLRMTLPI